MVWLKSHARWALLNLFALAVLFVVITQGSRGWERTDLFDPMLESGKWAIRFLLLCLTMTPLHTYLGWSSALPLRKPAGLWAFGFGLLHLLYYLDETEWTWPAWPMPLYIGLGLFGMAILAALALTSNRWSMRRLGKNWKRLHRLVYLAGMAVVAHGLLATTMSKKVMVRDPQAAAELRLYLGVLALLLVVRIPQVRRLLQRIPGLRPARRQTTRPVVSQARPPMIPPPANPTLMPSAYRPRPRQPALRLPDVQPAARPRAGVNGKGIAIEAIAQPEPAGETIETRREPVG